MKKHKILKTIFSLLGFSTIAASCEEINKIVMQPDMYGCPYAEYVFDIDVRDAETKEPIEGIKVSLYKYGSDPLYLFGEGETDSNGKYLLTLSRYGIVSPLEVTAKDIDGPENGSYQSNIGMIGTLIKTEEGDGWYEGRFEGQATILLDKAEESEENAE